MITYKSGDLLNVKTGVIAHGCNAQGVMGSGVAKQIKAKYPQAYLDYLKDYQTYSDTMRTISLTAVSKNLWIANCVTQRYYGTDPHTVYVSYPSIECCFTQLKASFSVGDVTIHIPKIGAGLANGDWNIIETIINKHGPEKVTCWVL